MDDLQQRPTPPSNSPEAAMPADESFSKWSQTEDDDDLEVFVVGADDEQAPAAPPTPPALAVDLPTTVRDEDVDHDDWNDQSWLAELDELDDHAAPTSAPPRAPSSTPSRDRDARPAGSGFVDTAALPDRPAGDDEDRFQEVIQTLTSAATDEASARRVADADTAELLRELSMLSVDA